MDLVLRVMKGLKYGWGVLMIPPPQKKKETSLATIDNNDSTVVSL